MTFFKLILRGLRFYLPQHLGTLFAAAIGTTVLTGALLVGDSVRGTLREQGLSRLGKITSGISSRDRFFQESLATRLSTSGKPVVPGILLSGTVSVPATSQRVSQIQIVGIPPSFFSLANKTPALPLTNTSAFLNETLAARLKVKAGDGLIVRFEKPSALSREAPVSSQADSVVAVRVTVAGVLSPEQLGNFSLQPQQEATLNLFIDLGNLQNAAGLPGRANLALSAEPATALAVGKVFQLEDGQLSLTNIGNQLQLQTERVFLDESTVYATNFLKVPAKPILTYFVNELSWRTNSTPYSMITAATPSLVPEGLLDHEIVVTDWLQQDLGLNIGDSLNIKFFVLSNGGGLLEQSNTFKVKSIIPLQSPGLDRSLMPDFPGLSKAESSHDWDTGFPIDLKKIRPKDEQYWKDHRGTPKALITLAAGKKMWGNRYGSTTAIRIDSIDRKAVEEKLVTGLKVQDFNLGAIPLRQQALAASEGSQNFGELFLYFSFFIIVSAILLMAMMFSFSLERRTSQSGTLLALGFTPGKLRRLYLVEGILVSVIGGILGLAGGYLYAWAMVHGLNHWWQGAVASVSLTLFTSPASFAYGFVSSILLSIAVLWFTVRKQGKVSVHKLLSVLGPEAFNMDPLGSKGRSKGLYLAALSAVGIGSLLWMIFGSKRGGGQSAELFFGLAACVLLFGSGLLAMLLWSMARRRTAKSPTLGSMILQNASRRSKRTLTATLLLASGVFILLVAAANKKETKTDPLVRGSGTGGYNLICKTTRPLIPPTQWTNSNQILNLAGKEWDGVETIPLRKREGDEASCLNLNKPVQAQLLGVNPELLARAQTFQFAGNSKPGKSPWADLHSTDEASQTIAGIADATSLEWVMKIGVGDVYRFDLENGQAKSVKIMAAVKGSILQGSVIVSEANFIKLFPNESGYRMFLVRVPSNKMDAVIQHLNSTFEDFGMQVEPSVERLQRLESVENTFIATFESLGGLGLLIGTIGLAVVIFRTGMERRSEMALLRATGFKPSQILKLISFEHIFVTTCGLALGILSALPSLIPSVQAGEFHFTASLALTLGLIVVFALTLTCITSWIVSQEKGFDTLRSENT